VEGDRYVKNGCWDSIHVVEALDNDSRTSTTYKLTTTVMLHMGVERPELGDTHLSGSLTRQVRALVVCELPRGLLPHSIEDAFGCAPTLSIAEMSYSRSILALARAVFSFSAHFG
jgi:hypothetical protein